MGMMGFFEALTVAWCTLWATIAFRRLAKGARASIIFVYFIFYGLFVLPLISDFVLGMPRYSGQPGFYDSSRDTVTRGLYCLFLSCIPPFWLRADALQYSLKAPQLGRRQAATSALLFAGAGIPILLTFLAPQPKLYLQYGFVITQEISLPVLAFHIFMSAATTFAVLSASAFIASARNSRVALKWVSPFIAASIWLNGKRNIFALAVLLVILSLWYRGELRGKKLLLAVSVAIAFLGLFSVEYQTHLRQKDAASTSQEEAYDNVRVDYGRDSRVKMAMYAELHPTRIQILDFRGQSLLFDLLFWVPRSVWPDKPYPYAVYFTSGMLGLKADPLGWGMTTSILDECIANFSWLGLLVGPLLVATVCKIGDSCMDQQVSLFTTVIAALFLAVHLPAFMLLFLTWVLVVFIAKRKHSAAGPDRLILTCTFADGKEIWSLSKGRRSL